MTSMTPNCFGKLKNKPLLRAAHKIKYLNFIKHHSKCNRNYVLESCIMSFFHYKPCQKAVKVNSWKIGNFLTTQMISKCL